MRRLRRVPSGMSTLMKTSPFERVDDTVASFRWRPELDVERIPAPQRIAPSSLAIEASVVTTTGSEVGSGRLIFLHDPDGNPAWDGTFRFVSFCRADVDFDMVNDPLLSEVGWTWLTEALNDAGADYHDASGTVTAVSSRSFGQLATEADRAEVEIRASWTPVFSTDDEVASHIAAWQALLCTTAGLPPLPDGIIPLSGRLDH